MAFGFIQRALLASPLIVGGADAAAEAGPRAEMTKKFFEDFGIGLDEAEAGTLVQVNGALQALAGGMLTIGIFPRLSALALIGSLVPTTLAGHSFWKYDDKAQYKAQRMQFLKNAAIVAGLLVVVFKGKSAKRK